MTTTSGISQAAEGVRALSDGLAELAAGAAPAVVRVDGGRRRPASGAVWSEDGAIVTASHALERDEGLEAGLEGGETLPARLVGRDPATDLAVIRVERRGLVPASWGDGGRPGQLVLALSRPGRGLRAALGVLARAGGEWRTPAGGRVDRWLELDLAPRPGFSGGPVLDASGRALGLAAGGLLRGHALAVPPETLRRVVEALLAHGAVRRGFLGIATIPVRLPPAAEREAGRATALLVTAVEPGSPAEQAGLALGDALLAVEDRAVAHAGELLPLLEPERIGQPLRVRLWRGGAARELRVVVGARGDGSRP